MVPHCQKLCVLKGFILENSLYDRKGFHKILKLVAGLKKERKGKEVKVSSRSSTGALIGDTVN